MIVICFAWLQIGSVASSGTHLLCAAQTCLRLPNDVCCRCRKGLDNRWLNLQAFEDLHARN